MNPATAFGLAFCDELARCGLREVVLAPGSRSTPLAMAFGDLEQRGRLRLHVRIDERSASFTALGLAKASRRPVAVLCTSGTAAANFHPAVIEADESGVPLLVLTADRPPELRGTGANQAIDQIKLYGGAVRWFCEAGVPERRAGAVAYWRSLACQAWAHAAGRAGGFGQDSGPVHLNLAFRDPLTPDLPAAAAGLGQSNTAAAGLGQSNTAAAGLGQSNTAAAGQSNTAAGDHDWPEPLDGRPDGTPWTRFWPDGPAAGQLELPWTERGVVICGDGDYDAAALVDLAEQAGWPVLAEPSSGARRGPNALPAYQYLLTTPEFIAANRPDVIVSAGRPGLSRPQSALLAAPVGRHVVIGQGPGRWADPQRAATDVAAGIRLRGTPAGTTPWLREWQRADDVARRAVDAVLDAGDRLTEPRLARDLVLGLPEDALLWAASSMPVRDIDFHAVTRADVRVLANRGTSGIDGTVSAAIGAALAHAGPAFALIGDLAFLHDAPGLALGPTEPRPDLCLVVVNNDGGGIFSALEQAAFTGSFERLFGTPHGAGLDHLAAAFGLPYQRLDQPEDLGKALAGTGLRIVEAQTSRADGAALRGRLREAAAAAIRAL
ncbi:MAG TPA: 2-succinyl-5-enolpyruvyl-6-hydroxy-3-cyclohexene-1-carboxylic-acid synthase [Streptosporangiaceae bacterium]|nr:2-succinyl-5-enolpyruvyl-6-hydroxy-3-cyclohexene-1-carboxylic-acid synthase [Streptosporangiaceae bacterium]